VKEFAVYTVARIGLFVASYAVIAGVYMLATGSSHVPLFWPFLLAALISAVASYYLLSGQRARFAARVEQRASNLSRRFDEARAREDAER
jgi:Protein of unknown function (DUF4229)